MVNINSQWYRVECSTQGSLRYIPVKGLFVPHVQEEDSGWDFEKSTKERILSVMQGGEAMPVLDIAEKVGGKATSVRSDVSNLFKAGLIERVSRGVYRISESEAIES